MWEERVGLETRAADESASVTLSLSQAYPILLCRLGQLGVPPGTSGFEPRMHQLVRERSSARRSDGRRPGCGRQKRPNAPSPPRRPQSLGSVNTESLTLWLLLGRGCYLGGLI